MKMTTMARGLGVMGVLGATLAFSTPARAQAYERREGYWDRDLYAIEVEPHFAFGAEDTYGSTGFGGGVRFGIPFAYGHLGRVPQNLAIDFGADVLHYDNCYYGNYCGANYVLAPVALQWNVFVVRRVSIFAEGGAFVYKGWYDQCQPGDNLCNAPSDFGVLPTFALGARIHMGRNVSLMARLGYPTSTIGVSFM